MAKQFVNLCVKLLAGNYVSAVIPEEFLCKGDLMIQINEPLWRRKSSNNLTTYSKNRRSSSHQSISWFLLASEKWPNAVYGKSLTF